MVWIRIALAWAAVICLIGVADAKVYRWVDENGVTHFSNTAPPEAEVDVHTRSEVKGAGAESEPAPGLDQVIDSYRQDEQRDQAAARQRQRERNQAGPGIDPSKISLYEKQVARDAVDLKQRREDLKQAERESYGDLEAHRAKVQRNRTRVRKAELKLEESRIKLEKARKGQ